MTTLDEPTVDREQANTERRELAEALAREAAMAEIMGLINSSRGDFAPVFDAILERAHALCGAPLGSLVLYDGERLRTVATRGYPSEYDAIARKGRPAQSHGQFAGLLRGERYVSVTDAAALSPDDNPLRRAAVEIAGVRTALFLPLRKDGALLGYISFQRQEVLPFTERQIGLLQNFAAQAVIAMENARLITETREALDQQTATAEVLSVINSSRGDLTPVFDAILEKAHTLCGATNGALVIRDGEHLRAVATHGLPEEFAELLRRPFPARSSGLHERLFHGDRLIHIADQAADEPMYPLSRAAVEVAGARTLLIIPLRKDEFLLGFITAFRLEVRPFSDLEISLLENFAAQAVIAIENARLITETREALEQQTATAEVLQVINSSPGDLAPVFEAMLDKALRLCEAAFGFLNIYDGKRFTPAAQRGVPAALAEYFGVGMDQPQPGDAHWRLLAGEDLIHNLDQMDEEAYRSGNPLRRAVVDKGGARSALVVALRKDGAIRGALTIYRKEVRPFSSQQISLLQSFAAQAVIAMENARLITETREALEQQTATAEVLQVINSSPGDLAPVFDAILEKAHTLCGVPYGSLVLYDGENLRPVATRGYPEEYNALVRQGFLAQGFGPFERLLKGERFVHNPDTAADSLSASQHPIRRALREIARVRSVLLVPLRKDGSVLGSISAQRQEPHPFSGKEIALLENFAAQAVIAMENARLLGELRARTDEVAAWNRELEDRVAAQLGELERVGKLKRFLAPQLAELIVASGDEGILETHRREIVVVFCDLRGFTAFAETAEPEEVLDLLREYHGAMGPIVSASEGTLDHFSGDGIMVFFNDPVPIPDAAERAVTMAVAMREEVTRLRTRWRRLGRDIGFGVGIAQGYATLGQIGFAERIDYTAIGTVCNLAARLCAEATDGQILISRRVSAAVEDAVRLEEISGLSLKGLSQAVTVHNVLPQQPAPMEPAP